VGKFAVARPLLGSLENPAYINLQVQLNSVTSSLGALVKTRIEVKRQRQDYATRLERTSEIEPNYLVLTRDRDSSGQKYQDIRSRLLEAKVSEGLEVQRKGERFSLIDPPSLPEKPDKPNRSAIVLLAVSSPSLADSVPALLRSRWIIRYARPNSLRN
jgi:polysaccharide biosynthesis transport protein